MLQAFEDINESKIVFPILTNQNLQKVKIIGLRKKPNQAEEGFESFPKDLVKDKLVLASLEGYETAVITALFCLFEYKGQKIEDTFACEKPIPLENNAGISITVQKNAPRFVNRTKEKRYTWNHSFNVVIEPLAIKDKE
jgi:hypothetical protein